MTARTSYDTAPKGRRPQNRGFAPQRPSGVALACRGPVRWNRNHRNAPDASVAFITEGSEVVGTCSFSGSVILNGRVKGDIRATGTLSIARGGRVEARLHAPIVLVEGEVVGSIVAAERIELRAEARVYGDLETAVLVIEEGAVFEGQTRPPLGQGAEARRDGAGNPRPGPTTTVAALAT
jgi:cytoskeletal protein CcmA (bactofilin family)